MHVLLDSSIADVIKSISKLGKFFENLIELLGGIVDIISAFAEMFANFIKELPSLLNAFIQTLTDIPFFTEFFFGATALSAVVISALTVMVFLRIFGKE